MRYLKYLVFSILIAFALPVVAQDRATQAAAYVHQAQNAIGKNDYTSANRYAENALKVDPSNATAKSIKSKCDVHFAQIEAEKKRKAEERKRKEEERRQEQERLRQEAIQRENNAFNEACDAETESALRDFINRYPKSSHAVEANHRIADLKLWNEAKTVGTREAYLRYKQTTQYNYYVNKADNEMREIDRKDDRAFESACGRDLQEAYREYINRFQKGRHVDEANKRIHEIQLWSNATSANTLEAYNTYLSTSELKLHRDRANEAIASIQAENDWNRVQNSESLDEIEAYLKKYPNSIHKDEATYRLNLMLGEKFYKEGENNTYYKNSAYDYLSKADGYRRLSGKPLEHLNNLKAWKEFDKYQKSTDITAVQNYLNSLAQSNHYNDYYAATSKHLAKLMADHLSSSYSKDAYKQAFSYAVGDKQTEDYVKRKKEEAKQIYKYEQRQRKYSSVSSRSSYSSGFGDWMKQHFQIGFEADLDFTILDKKYYESDDYDCENTFIAAGLMLRFGRSTDLFNFLVGAKYRYLYYSDGVRDVDVTGYAITIPANVRFNLFPTSSQCSFFIGAGFEYGFKVKDFDCPGYYDKNCMSVYPQIGWTTSHFDCSVYYKCYLKGPYLKEVADMDKTFKCKTIVGVSVGYYF